MRACAIEQGRNIFPCSHAGRPSVHADILLWAPVYIKNRVPKVHGSCHFSPACSTKKVSTLTQDRALAALSVHAPCSLLHVCIRFLNALFILMTVKIDYTGV